MSLFSDNIRYLRLQKNISQEKLAEALLITRARYVKYESGTSEAPYDILKKMAHYYHVSIDLLLSVDLRKIDMEGVLKLDGNRLLLPVTVDKAGENIIEIIPQKAQAGYLAGYSDPEFIETLQHISLPFLRNGKFRAFPIEGNSMPPFRDGSFIVGEYVEDSNDIKDGQTYVLLTKNDGIVYKRIYRKGRKFMFHSDNPEFEPYEVKASDILEAWKFSCGFTLNEYTPDDIPQDTVKNMLLELKREVNSIKKKLL
ncbi:XRE family transcriptional regulator [Flavobacterium psychrotrophum]|uniref:XRE family transcriptional regulator n=1 Tax=Flavobacterium psychrotrophum TaxID=2294119 RepID=UPI000E31AC16|nr:LexA family transcriptional regulator [Flavobacterium psychrotrophum]